MTQNTTSAVVAWATPVRPDELGEALEAYAKAASTLNTLRLCHRFGQGSKVHITKLPVEIELLIEALIIKAAKAQIDQDLWDSHEYPFPPSWFSAFRHFEGDCAPMDHMPDIWSPLNDQAFDDPKDFCASCDDYNYYDPAKCLNFCRAGDPELCWTCAQKLDADSCMYTCNSMVLQAMNEVFLGWGSIEWDDDDCESWRERIDPGGDFAKYAEVLRRHFGLNVHFIETRIAVEDNESWPRRLNHRHHSHDKLKTTLCYLTLRPHLVPAKIFVPSDVETDLGTVCYSAAQAVTVPREVLSGLRDSDHLKFRRAMNVLGLKPYLHPSQQGNVKTAQTPTEATTTASAADALNQDWPQLTFMFQSNVID